MLHNDRHRLTSTPIQMYCEFKIIIICNHHQHVVRIVCQSVYILWLQFGWHRIRWMNSMCAYIPWKRLVHADAVPSILPARLCPRTCARDMSASHICYRQPKMDILSVNSLWRSESNRERANFSVLDGFCCYWNNRRCLCYSCNHQLNLSALRAQHELKVRRKTKKQMQLVNWTNFTIWLASARARVHVPLKSRSPCLPRKSNSYRLPWDYFPNRNTHCSSQLNGLQSKMR